MIDEIINSELRGPLFYILGDYDEGDLMFVVGWIQSTIRSRGLHISRPDLLAKVRLKMDSFRTEGAIR